MYRKNIVHTGFSTSLVSDIHWGSQNLSLVVTVRPPKHKSLPVLTAYLYKSYACNFLKVYFDRCKKDKVGTWRGISLKKANL